MKLSEIPVISSISICVVLIFFSETCLRGSSGLIEHPQDTHKTANTPKQPVYFTTRLTTDRPVIDGKLDDDCWKTGTWAGDFHQYIPDEGAKATWPTVFNLLYDDKYVYIAIRAFDGEPEKIQRFYSPKRLML